MIDNGEFIMVKILYSDEDIIICEKEPGMLSEDADRPESLPRLLKQQLGHAVYPLHRLDKPVGGAIMYAASKKAAAEFSRLVSENKIKKTYLTVLDGCPNENSGELHDLLFKDSRKNKTYVVKRMRKGIKEAALLYAVISSSACRSLVRVELITGRSHQIRAQFASRKTPVTGDGKYGSRDNRCQTALWSHSLEFQHPFTGQNITAVSEPPYTAYPWNEFKTESKK